MIIAVSIILAIIIMGAIFGLCALAVVRPEYFAIILLIFATLCIAATIYSGLR